jgi:acetylornithine deacetylase
VTGMPRSTPAPTSPSDTTVDLLRQLVAFDTTSRHSNFPLIEFVEQYLSDLGIESRRVLHTDNKANLYATIGTSEAVRARPGIAVSAHTDVVPVEGQDWATDPWTLTEQDGRFYGRGTADMKGFLAVVLASLPRFVEADLETPLHLVCTPDEEVGCVGVLPLLADLEARDARPQLAIVGEPTSMGVIVAHKGHYAYRCHIRGIEAHSSFAPRAVNAIEYGARLVTRINDIARGKADAGPFDEAYPVAHTTLHTGVFEGGTAFNIVPRHAHFDFEIRTVGTDTNEELFGEIERYATNELLLEMRTIYPEAAIEFEVLSSTRGLDTQANEAVVATALELTEGLGSSEATGVLGKVNYATEAGLFQAAGIPVVVCGPGSIEQAHGPNEYVNLEQLARAEVFIDRLLERLSK